MNKKEQTQKPFKSKLDDKELKSMVDTVTKVNFQEVKDVLVNHIHENFGEKAAQRDLARLQTVATPARLQQFYYSYLLAASGNKVI